MGYNIQPIGATQVGDAILVFEDGGRIGLQNGSGRIGQDFPGTGLTRKFDRRNQSRVVSSFSPDSLSPIKGILLGCERFEGTGKLPHPTFYTQVDARLAFLAFFGGDDNYTICSANPVKGSSRGILEDVDGRNVAGVDCGQGVQGIIAADQVRDIVNYDQGGPPG